MHSLSDWHWCNGIARCADANRKIKHCIGIARADALVNNKWVVVSAAVGIVDASRADRAKLALVQIRVARAREAIVVLLARHAVSFRHAHATVTVVQRALAMRVAKRTHILGASALETTRARRACIATAATVFGIVVEIHARGIAAAHERSGK